MHFTMRAHWSLRIRQVKTENKQKLSLGEEVYKLQKRRDKRKLNSNWRLMEQSDSQFLCASRKTKLWAIQIELLW